MSSAGKSKEWEIPTGEGQKPLKMALDTRELADHSLRLVFTVSGLRHPHVEYGNYMGDEAKNPALLPAAKHAVDLFRDAAHAYRTQHPELEQASTLHRKGGLAEKGEILPSLGSFSVMLDFNEMVYSGPAPYKPIAPQDLNNMFDAVAAKIEAGLPQVKEQLEKHAHLQPSQEPTKQEVRRVNKKVEDQWATSMRVLERGGMVRAKSGSLTKPVEDN